MYEILDDVGREDEEEGELKISSTNHLEHSPAASGKYRRWYQVYRPACCVLATQIAAPSSSFGKTEGKRDLTQVRPTTRTVVLFVFEKKKKKIFHLVIGTYLFNSVLSNTLPSTFLIIPISLNPPQLEPMLRNHNIQKVLNSHSLLLHQQMKYQSLMITSTGTLVKKQKKRIEEKKSSWSSHELSCYSWAELSPRIHQTLWRLLLQNPSLSKAYIFHQQFPMCQSLFFRILDAI